jgi:nucleoside-diphosphate-sugar epimerase
MLTHHKAREISHKNWVAEINKLNDAGFWKPKVAIKEGFEKSITWYKDKNLI